MSPIEPYSPDEASGLKSRKLRLDLQQTLENCIVVDIETTGLQPQDERIIEVAALRIYEGELQDQFTTLLNPRRSVPQEITDLTGISDGLLADKPSFAEVMPELLSFLRDTSRQNAAGIPRLVDTPRLVGHNVSFDFSFLQHEILRAQLSDMAEPRLANPEELSTQPYTPRLVCTAEASRTLIPRESVGRYRLGNVASYLKVPHRPLHRAMSDALATYDVLRALSAQ
ncbi:3'-5' exonuclease [uncultured Corynebacterium sp.]|uniref:3'-5' exonuclease n=1 Tax=uncultured Corynebacterium sp. TaxID=159447 RepID=UPI0025EBDF63|nr:3'-5' exonuclease [uncultured Corynebacterium sp.]